MAAAMNESSSLKPSKVSTAICTSKLPLKMMDQKARAYTAPSKISSTRRDRAVSAESDQRSAIVRRSEEHTSELQSLMRISYAVFCLKKKTITSSSPSNIEPVIERDILIHSQLQSKNKH